MDNKIKDVLDKLENYGYEAYVVGGYVRDYLLERESLDVDICTNATPKEIISIFNSIKLPKEEYGSITINYKGLRCEITTYRKDICYLDNRRPETIVYINDLKEDLLRRDFTMNTLCMNKDGKIIDMLNGKQDIIDRKIKTVGDANVRFEEDALRILRTIRFATILDFEIDDKVKKAIKKKRGLITKLSYYRKKEELDKIFNSINVKKGVKLLLEFKLDKYLELPNLKRMVIMDDYLGMWSQIYNDKYPFTKTEKATILDIRSCLKCDVLNSKVLYEKGPYILSIIANIQNKDKRKVIEIYDKLPIKKRKDINITSDEICKCCHIEPGIALKNIYGLIETNILEGKLANENDEIKKFLLKL